MNKNFIRDCFYLILIIESVKAHYALDCLTPNQENGHCMPLKSCRNVYNIFVATANKGKEYLSETDINFISNSYCGSINSVHYVCCLRNEIQLNIDGLNALMATCGIRHVNKVAYGSVANLYSFPWMALLKYNAGTTFKCGGSLINDRYVLTAAHCVKGQENILTHVRLGEYNISSSIDCVPGSQENCAPPVQDIEIEEFIVHHNYILGGFQHDIALLRLNRQVIYNRNVKPICMPLPGVRSTSNDLYIISGWGRTERRNSSDVLMAAVIKSLDCKDAYRNLISLNNQHICAGGEHLIDSCRGDSGGPLGWSATFNGRLRFVQFGIVSFGVHSCGQIDAPGIYTNVSHYMQWITDHIKNA